MDIKTLISFLTQSKNVGSVADSYWNDVLLLCRFDRESNSKGLPLYRDYSKYQTQLREMIGSIPTSNFALVDETTIGSLPAFPTNGNISVSSFGYVNNKANHLLRISELNSLSSGQTLNSTLLPTYLETVQNGNPYLSLGTSDFTIEFSFFADEVALPWKYQTIFSVGICLRHDTTAVNASNIATSVLIENLAISKYAGYGVFLENNSLIFIAQKTKYTLATSLTKNTWYHVCIQRVGNTLQTYLNTELVYSTAFTKDLTYTYVANEDTRYNQLHIGSHGFSYTGGTTNIVTSGNLMDTSFSGGIANFRITKSARYLQDFYTLKLPFPLVDTANKIDTEYANTLFNIPLIYDLYDYGQYLAHFTDKNLLKQTPDFRTGFLYLDGVIEYKTANISDNLGEDWTIEFYLTPYINAEIYSDINRTIEALFSTYQVYLTHTGDIKVSVPLIKLLSNNNKVLEITYELLSSRTFGVMGGYLALKVSENGSDWLTYLSETDIDYLSNFDFSFGYYPWILPNNEIKFFARQTNGAIDGLPYDNIPFKSAFTESNTHVAIQFYNGVLYFLVNGTVIKTVSFSNTVYQSTDNLEMVVGGEYDLFPGRKQVSVGVYEAISIGMGIKGIKVSNVARYDTLTTNNYTYLHSLQPLALASNTIAPARVRVLEILRSVDLPSVSTDSVSWVVYWNQPISGLSLADFTLTQLEGISGATLTDLDKLSEYEYQITADTGSGNGRLQLNFIDRKTLTYKGTSTLISNSIGELSYTGEEYVINKNAPVPILSSGSNPYISSEFTVTLTFDGAISTINQGNIGISNGVLEDFKILDDVNKIYEFTVVPNSEGVVIVQALEGTGVTDSAVNSSKSEALTRIYSESFVILQLPLTLATSFNDYSPDRLVLEELVDNNTLFTSGIAPLGSDSSLHVYPTLEQGGLIYNDFNSVAATLESQLDEDWTIEFFLRIDSSSNKTAHILSVENGTTGFCIFTQNKTLKIQRSITNTSNLFSNITITDIDTPTFIAWDNSSYTTSQKFPHFAITKKGSIYRFYRNGVRVGIIDSDVVIDITKGDLKVGYYQNRVSDTQYYLSNVRLTLGKALYTAYQVNIPQLPFTVPLNIVEETELLNYISINSTNIVSNVAREDDDILLRFSSIIPLNSLPTVTLLGRSVTPTLLNYNNYIVTTTVLDTDPEGEVEFSISITGQVGIPDRTFTDTTNSSTVVIDNTALSASITTQEPNNNNHQFTCYIEFSEPVKSFKATDLTTSNCTCTNILKLSSSVYSFIFTGLSNGTASIQLEANKVQDLASNYNIASSIFSRNVQVPAYIPDPHWDNVLLLLQPTGISIVDESLDEVTITATQVEISNEVSPIGIDKSIHFNGIGSSLSFTLDQSLNSSIDYTIEFFVYVSSTTVFRLSPPDSLPASSILATSFKANWDEVENATGYILDVSENAVFSTFVPGFKQKSVGDVNNYSIDPDTLTTVPDIDNITLVSDSGFVAKWDYPYEKLGFVYDVALDSLFTKKIYRYNNKFTNLDYVEVGNIENLTEIELENPVISDPVEGYTLEQGTILTGLIGNSNYPKLMYFLEESSIRLYKDNEYSLPAIVEDVDPMEWMHLAVVNSAKYTYLYVNGELRDKIRNVGFSTSFDVGYSVGNFVGYMTGFRITKGIARYTGDFTVPSLPYPKA